MIYNQSKRYVIIYQVQSTSLIKIDDFWNERCLFIRRILFYKPIYIYIFKIDF